MAAYIKKTSVKPVPADEEFKRMEAEAGAAAPPQGNKPSGRMPEGKKKAAPKKKSAYPSNPGLGMHGLRRYFRQG